MSKDTPGIVSLNYIVHRVLMDRDDNSMRHYKKMLQYAIDGYTKLNLYSIETIRVAYLEVDQNTKQADLPEDYLFYTKIGYNKGGVAHTLSLNDDLMLVRKNDDCGNGQNDNLSTCGDSNSGKALSLVSLPYSGYYYTPHYRNGQFVAELYGGRGNQNNAGYYRIDKQRRKIVFNSDIALDEVILEYKSSGVRADGETLVSREYAPTIIAYIHWQLKEYKDKVAQSEKMRLKQRYIDEEKMVRRLNLGFTIEEYLDITRNSYRQTPKR
jgi:hypothetical protein